MKTFAIGVLILGLSLARVSGQGTILWDESIDGPFSNSSATPTALTPLQMGSNSVFGVTQVVPNGSGWTLSPDFFTTAVPDNLSIKEIWITVTKSQLSAWVGSPTFDTQLAYEGNAANGSLLSQWEILMLGSGIYGIHMENHDFQSEPSSIGYRLDFFVESVPEPGTISLGLLGLGLLAFSFRKRGK